MPNAPNARAILNQWAKRMVDIATGGGRATASLRQRNRAETRPAITLANVQIIAAFFMVFRYALLAYRVEATSVVLIVHFCWE